MLGASKKQTYLVLVEAHEPVDHVVKRVYSILVLVGLRRVRPVDSGNAFVLPAPAEGVLVVKQTQLLNDVVHDKVSVDNWLVGHVLFEGLAQLAYLVDVKPLVGVYFQHAHDQTP